MRGLLLLIVLLATAPAFAGVEQISERDFRALAAELSPKVNLFHEAWEKDPEAQFYGGTTRDYLYWLKGKFREAHSPRDAAKVAAELRARPAIDVREFIIGDSDVDIFAPKGAPLDPRDFGVRKIDAQKLDVLNPETELGKNEVNQGFLPAEKIRLTREGLETTPQLGDGVREIYSGKLSVHFASAEDFAKSKYAAEGINHPILLALRYLRLQAINYFQEHGGGAVDPAKVLATLDPESARAVHAVIDAALDGKELKAPLDKPQFQKWINAAIQKAFRSYTNPNAARALMNEFRVTELPAAYAGKIEPVNQYVFAKHRDERAVATALKAAELDPAKLYRSVATEFPDGFLYHGTKTEEAFRGILFQGVLGSESGTGGAGLYGVSTAEKAFAENWGGARDRLLRFPVSPHAKIVDVTEGEGAHAWANFKAKHGENYEAFAEAYGADIVRYPYGQTRAYVVKNSAVLGRAQGVHRELLPLPELLEKAKTIKTFPELSNLLSVNGLTRRERGLVIDQANLPMKEVESAFQGPRFQEEILREFFPRPPFSEREDLIRDFLGKITNPYSADLVMRKPSKPLFELLATDAWKNREDILLETMLALNDPAGAARNLAKPGVPYFPKVWRAMSSMKMRVSRIELVEVFHNPNYAREAETFHQLLTQASDFSSMPSAALALAEPWWTNHPEWVSEFLEHDLQSGTAAGYLILGSEAWNKAHPEFIRSEFKRYLRDPRFSRDYSTSVGLLKKGIHPFDEEAIGILLERSPTRSSDLAELIRKGTPNRDLILRSLLKLPTLDDNTVRILAGCDLPAEARAKLLPWLEASLASLFPRRSMPLFGLMIDFQDLRRLGGPSESFATKMMEAAKAQWASRAFFDEEARSVFQLPTLTAKDAYLHTLRDCFSEQIATASSRTEGWEPFRVLLKKTSLPESYEPLLLDLLAAPELPADLRARVGHHTRNLIQELGYKGPDQVLKTRPLLAYQLAHAQPALLQEVATAASAEAWLAKWQGHEGSAFAAALLAERASVGPATYAVVEQYRDVLKHNGIAIPSKICRNFFGALKEVP